MTIKIRKANERGYNKIDWLESFFTFSFDRYIDREWVQFKSLRVINEDYIQPGQGFGMHPHREMEIMTYIISGSLEHRDSQGNHGVIKPGEVQRMSAGTGIMHSEFNASKDEVCHLYQIWIIPGETGIPPSYEQKTYQNDNLTLIASNNPDSHSVKIHQSCNIYKGNLKEGDKLNYDIKHNGLWLQLIKGDLNINDHELSEGDALQIENESDIKLISKTSSEFLMFDLA